MEGEVEKLPPPITIDEERRRRELEQARKLLEKMTRRDNEYQDNPSETIMRSIVVRESANGPAIATLDLGVANIRRTPGKEHQQFQLTLQFANNNDIFLYPGCGCVTCRGITSSRGYEECKASEYKRLSEQPIEPNS